MGGEVCVQTLHRLRKAASFRTLMEAKYPANSGKKIVVDYSSPNIAKQFHIGNLRSTLIGRYVDTVNRVLGNNVTSVNYLGDWGTQFAMIAAFWPQMRPSDQYWSSLSDLEKIKQLTDCYVIANKNMKTDEEFRERVHQIFVEMEQMIIAGDVSNEHMHLWMSIRELSKNHLSEFYTMFDIRFDRWMNESSQVKNAYQVVDELINKNVLEGVDGRQVIRLDKNEELVDDGNNKKQNGGNYAILRKSNNTSLYLTREIASILERDQMFNADRYLYVVDRAQRQHFKSLKIILEKMGRLDLADKLEHLQYGRVRGLSTRNGRTEAVGEIVNRGCELALQFMKSSVTFCLDSEVEKEIAKVLSVSTVVFNELKRARNSEYEFSFQNAFKLNQNNALSIQMKHSRLSSMESKHEHLLPLVEKCDEFPAFDNNEDVKRLMRLLHELEEAIELSGEKSEPCQLTVHLIHIAQAVGTVQHQLIIRDQPEQVAVPRLLLFSAVRNVLAEGMKMLGMTPAKSM